MLPALATDAASDYFVLSIAGHPFLKTTPVNMRAEQDNVHF
jgi:hypothetical protein